MHSKNRMRAFGGINSQAGATSGHRSLDIKK